MPHLGSRGLHLVLILTKYLLTTPAFFLKVRTPFNPDNSVISLRLPNRNTMKFPDGARTHQCIGYDSSSSAWSLNYHLHTPHGLNDRTNKGASFVIEPLSIADIFCNRHLRGIRYACHDNRSNSHYPSIVISLSYGSISIRSILLTCLSVGMPNCSDYLIQQHHSLLRHSSRERAV